MKNARSVLRNFCISNLQKLQDEIVLLKEDEQCKDVQLRVMLTAVERENVAMKLPEQDLVAESTAFLGQFWAWTLQMSEKKTTLEATNEAFVNMVNMFDFEGATTANEDCAFAPVAAHPFSLSLSCQALSLSCQAISHSLAKPSPSLKTFSLQALSLSLCPADHSFTLHSPLSLLLLSAPHSPLSLPTSH